MEIDGQQQVQIKLVSKIEKFENVESTFSVPVDCDCSGLSDIVHASLLAEGLIDAEDKLELDFLANGELLRSNIIQFIEAKYLSTESVVEVEFILKQPSPTPEQQLLHNDWVSCVHANSKYVISGCYDNTVKIHTLAGKELLTLPAHSAPVRCLSWISSDGDSETFVTGSHDQLLHVWKWDTKNNSIQCLYKCAGHAFSVEAVTASPDKLQFASVSRDTTLKIWTTDERGINNVDEIPAKVRKSVEAKTKVPIITLSGHHEAAIGVCWNGPGDLITAGLDHTIRLWSLETQTNTQTLASSKALLCIDCSPVTGHLVTGSSDRHVRMWDTRIKDTSMVIGSFSSHTGWVSCVKWSTTNENLFISGSYDNLTKLWDTRSSKAPLYDLSGHRDKVLSVDWSNPAFMISGGADNAMNIFSYKS